MDLREAIELLPQRRSTLAFPVSEIGRIPVIESRWMTRTAKKQIARRFKPGQRKGRDKSLLKVYKVWYESEPDPNLIITQDPPMVVGHPVTIRRVEMALTESLQDFVEGVAPNFREMEIAVNRMRQRILSQLPEGMFDE